MFMNCIYIYIYELYELYMNYINNIFCKINLMFVIFISIYIYTL